MQRLQEKELTLTLDEAVLEQLVEVGFEPVYGARPLNRAIQQQGGNPLAQDILAGKFSAGDAITASLDGQAVKFNDVQPSLYC